MESFENRDLQCANEVSEMARLGKFNIEFAVYGSAVQESDGKVYYYATENNDKLYREIVKADTEERYFMPVIIRRKRIKIPADLKDAYLTDFKYTTLKFMKDEYEECISLMAPLFSTEANNESLPLLLEVKNQVEGYFDYTRLQLFWGLVMMAKKSKILSLTEFRELKRWYIDVRSQMASDPIDIGNINRIFYGFVYQDCKGFHCVGGAQLDDVIEKHRQYLMQNYLVAPILCKHIVVSQSFEMSRAFKNFKEWLLEAESIPYMKLIYDLQMMKGVIDNQHLEQVARQIDYSTYALKAVRYYQSIWNFR